MLALLNAPELELIFERKKNEFFFFKFSASFHDENNRFLVFLASMIKWFQLEAVKVVEYFKLIYQVS